MNRFSIYIVGLVLGLAACGNITRKSHDGGVQGDGSATTDAATTDGPVQQDAMVQLPATPAREVVGGAGRMTGTTYTLDVEVGMPMPPQKTVGAIHTVQPNTAIQQ